ncbi:MAG TPA: outer membrane beta-barrel protein [Gemmatirosa sp.]
MPALPSRARAASGAALTLGALASAALGLAPAGARAQSTAPTSPPVATDTSARTPAAPDTTPKVTFGGFFDGYYAYDFDRPPSRDRSFAGGGLFTTQPARSNEFNVNLAYVEAKLDAPRYRGRLAVQFGTSVQSNYFGEPRVGQISGPTVQQYLQEANAGVKLGKNFWIDGGIFFSNMGEEGWISRDNPTYTRSLVADYSPYYSSGVKFTYTPNAKLTARLDIVNGWQNISENNSGKGSGIRLDYAVDANSTYSYWNFFSDEAGNLLRTFNGVGAKVTHGPLTLMGEADIGTQRRPNGVAGTSSWYGLLAVARAQVSPTVAVVGRLERYDDPDQVILATGSRTLASPVEGGATTIANPAFRGNGASIGVDVSPFSRVLFRTELRGFQNRDAVFPDAATGNVRKADGFVVTSLALTF